MTYFDHEYVQFSAIRGSFLAPILLFFQSSNAQFLLNSVLSKQIQYFIQQMVSQPAFDQQMKMRYFILYSTTFVIYGQIITMLGPLFPFLSAESGLLQTEYSTLFTARAFGYVFGSLTAKTLQNRCTLHQIISLGIGLFGVFGIFFTFCDSLWMKTFFTFLFSCGCSYLDIGINVAALKCFSSETLAKWVQLLHGFFGIGGLLGPFTVYIFQLNSTLVLSILCLAILGFYFVIPTPQQKQDQAKTFSQTPISRISKKSLYLISALFFLTIGQECTYGGWISSYSVLKNYTTKQHATLYSSQYWISVTFFRFLLAFFQGSSSRKIQILGIIGAVNGIFSYLIINYVQQQLGLNIMSILFGLCNSSLFALLFTICDQFGFSFTISETTTFVVWASLGEGILAVGVGKMMEWFSYEWLIWGMIIQDVSISIMCYENEKEMIREKQRIQSSMNIKLIELHPTEQVIERV